MEPAMENHLPNENMSNVQIHASGLAGSLPLEPDLLTNAPSGDIFGWTQDAAMGWSHSDLGKDEHLILSTQDGSPIALDYPMVHNIWLADFSERI